MDRSVLKCALVALVGFAVILPAALAQSPKSGASGTLKNPVPLAYSLTPDRGTVGGPAFTLTVEGKQFVRGAVILWNGSELPTSFVNATTVRAIVSPEQIATLGVRIVQVWNPSPGGGVSNGLNFVVGYAAPVLGSLSPGSVPAGSANFTLTVNGSGFASGSTVQWDGRNLNTTFVNASQLLVQVTSGAVAEAKSALVQVVNPGVAPSAALPFVVQPVRARFAYASHPNANCVSGFRIDPATGALSPLGSTPVGREPYFLKVDYTNRFLYATNHASQNISAFSIDPDTGALTPVLGSPFVTGPDSMSFTIDPSNRFLYVPSESTDTIWAYRIDPNTGALNPIPGSPFATGSMPWSVNMDYTGRFAYVTNAGQDEVVVYDIDPVTGALAEVPGSRVSPGWGPNWVAPVPSGRFAYATNFFGASIAGYYMDDATGMLAPIPGATQPTGQYPQTVAMASNGRHAYVANAWGKSVSAYSLDPVSGAISPVAGSPFALDMNPSWLVMDNARGLLYVAEWGTTIRAFRLDSTGSLVPLGSTNAGQSLFGLALAEFPVK